VRYPAVYEFVVAVGAVCPNLTRVDFSNRGPELEYAAPGFEVSSTICNGEYGTLNVTSMAVPHVTAVAALIYSSKIDPEYGKWDGFRVREKLNETCLDLGVKGRDDEYGWGLINGWATNQRPLAT
jgi:subtilisin family serine protease